MEVEEDEEDENLCLVANVLTRRPAVCTFGSGGNVTCFLRNVRLRLLTTLLTMLLLLLLLRVLRLLRLPLSVSSHWETSRQNEVAGSLFFHCLDTVNG